MVGLSRLGDRRSGAVRAVLDEIEGTLSNIPKTAAITTQDIYLSTGGTWNAGTLMLDGRAFVNNFDPSSPANPDVDLAAGAVTRQGGITECLRPLGASNIDHRYAGIATSTTWHTTALNGADWLASTPVATANTEISTALSNPLFNGSNNYVIFNNTKKRFESGFYIAVVGLYDGTAAANAPVGVIVVPANSSAIYKFYKPSHSATWRRL